MRRAVIRTALVTVAVALLAFVIPLAIVAVLASVGQARSELARSALQASLTVGPTVAQGDPVELPTTGSDSVGLYGSGGSLVAGSGPQRWDAVSGSAIRGLVDGSTGEELVVAVPVSRGEQVVAVVRVARPWRTIVAQAVFICGSLAALAALVSALAYLAARRLGARLARPVESLASEIARIDASAWRPTDPTGLSEIDALSGALSSSADRLREVVRRERRIATHASHELRTPLSRVRVSLESSLAADPDTLRGAAREAIDTIDVLNTRIDDILSLTRGPEIAEGGDLRSILVSCVDRARGAYEESGRTLSVVLPDTGPRLTGPRRAVSLIVDVLLANALEHGEGKVTIELRSVRGAVAIDVADEGRIPAGSEVFEAGPGRAGIGLGMAATTARDHGGVLLLTDREPSTRFTLLLPTADS